MKPFLGVNWNNLLVVNYRVDPMALGLLKAQLPTGTELDDFEGEHYVSVVGFEFQKTRILGIPMPFYRDFAEINLRFYVRRMVDGNWRRGVVFIKEIVSCRLPAFIANKIFKENFHIRDLSCDTGERTLSYRWSDEGEVQELKIDCSSERSDPEPGSLTEHIIDHYWAYKKIDTHTTGEFEVSHRPWQVHNCPDAHIHLNIARVYGPEWAAALGDKPVSVFYADGSHVDVTKPQMITNPMKQ